MGFDNDNDQTLSSTYVSVITSIVGSCSTKIKGIASVSNDVTKPIGFNYENSKRNNAVEVNLHNGFIIIDIYINVYFGYVIPKIVCQLQEEIKNEVEKTTAYKVKTINVNIVGVLAKN